MTSNIWKLLTLVEIVDTLIPDPPLVVRTAITKKQNADEVNLNRTKTSQAAKKIEDQLAADLESLFNKIMNDSPKDFPVLQKRYASESEQLIRTAVQQLYLIGSDYATKSQNTTAFITQTDVENIKKQVNITDAAFWKRVYNEIHKNEFIIPTEEPQKPVDPAVQAALLSTVTATTTLALSTLSKLDQLAPGEKKKLVWISEQDSKVCEICRPLHGQEWEADDPTMPMPGPEPDDTHHNCRCRLLIKEGNDILTG